MIRRWFRKSVDNSENFFLIRCRDLITVTRAFFFIQQGLISATLFFVYLFVDLQFGLLPFMFTSALFHLASLAVSLYHGACGLSVILCSLQITKSQSDAVLFFDFADCAFQIANLADCLPSLDFDNGT